MRWLWLLSAFLLAGCERPVLSRHPLFQPADVRTAPPLREGVWLNVPSDGCAVDVAKPAAQWPDCADWTLVAQGRIVRTRLSGRRAPRRASEPFVLAAGDPRVLQEPAPDKPGFYRFTAVRPLQSDRDGRITAAETWLVVCPPKADRGEPQIVIPGLRVAKAACYVRDGPALSKVLVRSGDWGLHQTMRWVRDGDR